MHNFSEIGRFFFHKIVKKLNASELQYQLILLNKFQIIFYAFETLVLAIVYLTDRLLSSYLPIFEQTHCHFQFELFECQSKLHFVMMAYSSVFFLSAQISQLRRNSNKAFPYSSPFFIQACQPPFQGNNVLEWREADREFECSAWLGCGFTFCITLR